MDLLRRGQHRHGVGTGSPGPKRHTRWERGLCHPSIRGTFCGRRTTRFRSPTDSAMQLVDEDAAGPCPRLGSPLPDGRRFELVFQCARLSPPLAPSPLHPLLFEAAVRHDDRAVLGHLDLDRGPREVPHSRLPDGFRSLRLHACWFRFGHTPHDPYCFGMSRGPGAFFGAGAPASSSGEAARASSSTFATHPWTRSPNSFENLRRKDCAK